MDDNTLGSGEPLEAFSDYYELEELADSTPQEFANLEAAKELRHEQRGELVDRLLHRAPSPGAEGSATASADADPLHELAVEEQAEDPHRAPDADAG